MTFCNAELEFSVSFGRSLKKSCSVMYKERIISVEHMPVSGRIRTSDGHRLSLTTLLPPACWQLQVARTSSDTFGQLIQKVRIYTRNKSLTDSGQHNSREDRLSALAPSHGSAAMEVGGRSTLMESLKCCGAVDRRPPTPHRHLLEFLSERPRH